MTLEERVAKANYIYASPIKWGLKKYICSVSYYKTEPIDDLSWVICSVLNINGGSYEKRSLGVLLGFSMMDVVVDDKTTSYVDIAEINLFEDILKRIENEHLIQVSESYVNLTKLGKVALEEKKLFYFYNGYKNLYEHLSLKSSKSDLKYYPFYKDLGIATVLSNDGQYWPDDDLIPEIIHPKESSLLERLLLQSNQNNNIFKASQGEYFDIEEKTIEARLYKDENGYFPVLMNGENIAKEVTNILWSKENSLLYENVVLECRFKKLWDDNDIVLNYNTLKPFFELVDFENLTQDKRTVWTDEDLLDVIVKRSNANCWINISKFCDLNVIKQHMPEFVTKLNWQQITRRVDDEYLIKTFKKLPWDFEVLSQDIERDNSTIEELIVIGKNSEEDWDWDELQSRLSDNFVLSNLDKVKIDLAKFTSDTIEVRKSILAFPNGMWDWNKIVNDFGLDFLLTNISILSSHIDLTKLFDRVFIDIDWTKKFLCNDKLLISVSDNIQNGGKLSSFLANDKPYVWTFELIDWMEKEGFVFWNSNEYTKGLETNPYLNWTYDFFSRYWVKVSSQEGANIISSTIQDVSIINDFQKFNWNWDLLSSNVALLKQKNFLNWYKYKLNWENVLTYIPDIKNVQELNGIDKLIGENENAWKTFSSKADLQFVKFNYTYPWNWSILTSL